MGKRRRNLVEEVCRRYERGERSYTALRAALFDPEDYPNAWRCSARGGPPGCAMALGAALRKAGIARRGDRLIATGPRADPLGQRPRRTPKAQARLFPTDTVT